MIAPAQRVTAVDAVAAALRARILDGDLEPGARLREQELVAAYDAARHTVRAALRALAAEGLVTIEAHRGARVRALDADAVRGLFELRCALEVEGARLALERHDGRLPRPVHDAVARFSALCREGVRGSEADPDGGDRAGGGRASDAGPAWSDVVDSHEALHHAIVAAGEAPRITAAHAALGGELRLFLARLRPRYTLAELATQHEQLVKDLVTTGPDVLRGHIRDSTAMLLDELEP